MHFIHFLWCVDDFRFHFFWLLCDDYRCSLSLFIIVITIIIIVRMMVHSHLTLTHLNVIAIALNVHIEKWKFYFWKREQKNGRWMLWTHFGFNDGNEKLVSSFFELFPLFRCVCLSLNSEKTHATKLYGSTQRVCVCVCLKCESRMHQNTKHPIA